MKRSAYILLELEVLRLLEEVVQAMKLDALSEADGAVVARMVLEVRRFITIEMPRTEQQEQPEPPALPGVDIDAVHRNPRWRNKP